MVIFLHSALHDTVRCDKINQLIPSTIANVIISVGVNDECSHVPDTQHDMSLLMSGAHAHTDTMSLVERHANYRTVLIKIMYNSKHCCWHEHAQAFTK